MIHPLACEGTGRPWTVVEDLQRNMNQIERRKQEWMDANRIEKLHGRPVSIFLPVNGRSLRALDMLRTTVSLVRELNRGNRSYALILFRYHCQSDLKHPLKKPITAEDDQ